MPPYELFVKLEKGIVGGIIAPIPSEIHVLKLSIDRPNQLVVDSRYRVDGTRILAPANSEPKTVSLVDNVTHNDLIDELRSILETLPVEYPRGSQDIYRMDTSIFWGSRDFNWVNGAPSSCIHGVSEVQPTEEEIIKFKRAVEIVRELATA